jgi:type 1 glutamine amidotransferase
MKRALVVWGGLELHQPEQGAEVVRSLLAEEGFEVVVTSDYEALVAPDVGMMDLVVPVITDGQMDDDKMKVLVAAIRAGTGLASYHAGLATSFRQNFRFHDAAGCYWVSHPGNVITYRVDVAKPDDPVMAGIESFEHVSEQYYLLVDPAVEVLATTTFSGEHDDWRKGVVMPVVYKSRFGAGRVFYSSLGHRAHELELPHVRTILKRGLVWAAR